MARSERTIWLVKAVAVAAWAVLLVFAGIAFHRHRTFREPVVLGPGVTGVKTLGDWFAPLKGTVNDCNIYLMDSGRPGATILLMGGTHPEEPGANLAADLVVEHAVPKEGRLIVAIHMNRSASTVTRPGDAYPQFFTIPTPWGSQTFRMGDRWANPLDSWPDPETYVNYPSGQMLAYMDIRNANRAWPGRPNGLLVEQTTYAFMQLIRAEHVDLAVDYHEAELEYPVIGTIVAHQKAQDLAAMVSMDLSANEFQIGMEISPKPLHGLSHREIGDFSDSMGILMEAPEPFLDRVRGVTDERLLLTGQDAFVRAAGKAGLLYWPIDDAGWPIAVRVARHIRTTSKVFEVWGMLYPDKPISVDGLPGYQDLIASGVGAWLEDPAAVPKDRLAYE
jgi:hypothetical protein